MATLSRNQARQLKHRRERHTLVVQQLNQDYAYLNHFKTFMHN